MPTHPSPAPLLERVARGVVVVSSAWFAFTAFWGLFGIPGGGHLGAGSAGNVMAAEQIVRWHIWYPAWDWYSGQPPPPVSYICHHPFGQYWVPAVFLWIFGHRDFVVHLPASLMCAACPPMLYAIARAKWGVVPGAVAAAAYVVVPITVGYSNFTNLEIFCIFGVLLCFWGHTRHLATGKGRFLAASLVGVLFACAGDWAGYLLLAPTVVWAFFRAFVVPARLTPRFPFGPYARWWGLTVGLVAGTLLLWLAFFYKADKIGDWIMAATSRGGGEGMKLSEVLDGRKFWIEFSFTPLAIAIGKLALPVCLARVLVTRWDEETYALSFLFGAAVQYVAFKQGADVHIFWPIYFAPYYALALAQLAHAIGWLGGLVAGRVSPRLRVTAAAAVGLCVGLAPSLAMARDGVASLWVWRRTGGRYDDNGSLIRSHVDMLTVLEQVVLPRSLRGNPIDVNGSANWGWEHQWKYQGPSNDASLPRSGDRGAASHPFWIARGSGLLADAQRKVVAAGHVRVYGDTWLVDQREPNGPLDVFPLTEREPNPFEWLLIDGIEPRRRAGDQPDPWLTWEYRAHLGQDAQLPGGEPQTLDQMRVAHNVAVTRGDPGQASAWLDKIAAGLDRSVEARFDPWLRLVGARQVRGVQPRIETWWEVTAQPTGDAFFQVRSTIEARGRLSLIPKDETDRDMAYPPSLPTKLWKPGFLYRCEFVMNHRVGVERYLGHWSSRDGSPAPRRADHQGETSLAVVD